MARLYFLWVYKSFLAKVAIVWASVDWFRGRSGSKENFIGYQWCLWTILSDYGDWSTIVRQRRRGVPVEGNRASCSVWSTNDVAQLHIFESYGWNYGRCSGKTMLRRNNTGGHRLECFWTWTTKMSLNRRQILRSCMTRSVDLNIEVFG